MIRAVHCCHFILALNRVLSHEADEVLLWVSTLILVSSYSHWCGRELLSSLCSPIGFCMLWHTKASVTISWQLCGGRTWRKSRKQNIAINLSTYLVLGAPPAPQAIYVNKRLMRKSGFGQSRAGTCALCQVFNASNSCHLCVGCCTQPGHESNNIYHLIGSQMNRKSSRRGKLWRCCGSSQRRRSWSEQQCFQGCPNEEDAVGGAVF